MTTEKTTWTRRLAHVPDYALKEELQRRGEEADTDQAVHLPGLTVDPVAGQLVWRGEGYVVGGRMMELLYALALGQAAGRRRVRIDVLAERIFRGWDRTDALNNTRTVACYLRRRFPGLLATDAGRGGVVGYYRLAVDRVVGQAGVEGVA